MSLKIKETTINNSSKYILNLEYRTDKITSRTQGKVIQMKREFLKKEWIRLNKEIRYWEWRYEIIINQKEKYEIIKEIKDNQHHLKIMDQYLEDNWWWKEFKRIEMEK